MSAHGTSQEREERPSSEFRLSVCIPTYNFGAFIGETLSSVACQAGEDVEIVVLDGGSTDNTAEVVETYRRSFPRLRYRRKETRGGIDRDMAETVAMARGEYCWLFSADDTMEPGAIPKVLEHIREGIDVYLCGLTLCTFDLRPLRRHPVLDASDGAVFDLSVHGERMEYFRRARTTTAFFSFCGSLIFRKSRWDAFPLDEDFVGSCWAHVARFFRMIPRGLRVKYLQQPYLNKRGDNDSFLDRGIIHRVGIGIAGYHRLADTFFGPESREAYHIRRVLRNEYSLPGMLGMKLKAASGGVAEDREHIDRLAGMLYGDDRLSSRMSLAAYRLSPVPLLVPADRLYRFLRRFLPLP
jgi:abequosyltransferase